MPIEDLEKKLSQLDETFKNAPTDFDGRWMPDLGTHQAIFRSVDFFEKKDAPWTPFIKFVFEMAFGDDEGRETEIVHPLVPDGEPDYVEMKLGFLKRDLRTLGIDVDSDEFTFSQVRPGSPIWDGVLDCQVSLTVKDSKKLNPNTNRPYRNLFLDARIGDPLPKQERIQGYSDVPASKEDMAPPKQVTEDEEGIPF